ncbi:hypothetical protein [Agromyces salentinus]|uniref:Uncharacterized protein n=1 Tax=Agromyces salentinus TaxID=269421 RepID=A0ABN2MV79_9MICO|nr:hypothetical protein [Agromyces salentinus]
MSENQQPTPPSDGPDGSTNLTEEQKQYTERLGDGSPTGNATEDPRQDTDTASGGDPDDQQRGSDGPTRPEDVDLETGTDPDGAPIENPSGG